MARKIQERNQNNIGHKEEHFSNQQKGKNIQKHYIIAQMGNTFGNVDNYHLNEKYIGQGDFFQLKEKKNQSKKKNYKYSNNSILIKEQEKKVKKNKLLTTYINNVESIYNYFLNDFSMQSKDNNTIEFQLKDLWKYFGVTDSYISKFNKFKNDLNNAEKKREFLIIEYENLKKLEEISKKLKKEIESRDKEFQDIKYLYQKEESNENDKKKLSDLIASFREHSFKVVEYYLLFKHKIMMGNSYKKFNEEYIIKTFLSKNGTNYLIQMNNDTNSLINSQTNSNKDIFNNIYGDPFLLSFEKVASISNDQRQKIKYCHYYIIQEMINDQLVKENEDKNKNTFKNNLSNKKLKIIQKKNIYEENKNNDSISDSNANIQKNINHIKINCIKEENSEDNDENNVRKDESISKNSLSISKEQKKNKENSMTSFAESPDKKSNIATQINKEENVQSFNNSINVDNYNISYYCDSLSKFINDIYAEYYKKVTIEQKRIFNVLENPISYFSHNYYPKIIICKDTNSNLVKGICIYSVSFNCHNNEPNQIIIEHLSSYNNEEMEIILKNMLEFLKNNNILINSCNSNIAKNEIYLDLYYYTENEKFLIDKDICNFIKNDLKFKWVKLENISKGVRFQKMKHQFNNKNLEENFDNNELEQSIDENSKNNLCCNFYIKDNSKAKFVNKSEESQISKENLNEKEKKYINPFNMVYLIKKISLDDKYSKYIENNTSNFFINNDQLCIKELFNNDNNIELQKQLIDNNSFISSDMNQLINCLENNEIEKIPSHKFDIKTKMNIRPIFDNCISIKYKGYYFNRIENRDAKIFSEKETNQKFYYMTSKNNENIKLLISYKLNSKFKDKYICIQDNSNISLKFKEIYNNFDLIEENIKDKDKTKHLYIPSFDINSVIKTCYKKSNQENKSHHGDNDEKYIISKYDEYIKIKFFSEDCYYENNKINTKSNFYFDNIEDDFNNNKDCFIDDNFIIFVVNFDFIENIAVIPLISLYITKNNFISEI